MPRSTTTTAYKLLRALLVAARVDANLTQAQVAGRLGRPQSFVSKYEGGERGLDVIEFLYVCEALELDPGLALSEVRRVQERNVVQ